MSVYDRRAAILKAADHIESHPDQFEYAVCKIPKKCGTPGCALGWIAYFAGVRERRGDNLDSRAERALGIEYWRDFVPRMGRFSKSWREKPKDCARAMRGYAKKYHGATEAA